MTERGSRRLEGRSKGERGEQRATGRNEKKPWTTPLLEDVSGKIMAQPYIRFT